MVIQMIRLIGVLSEGGVPVVLQSYVETESEMIIGALISAAKTLCDAMGSGEVRQLAFKDNTLIVTESKKCYTVVALVSKAESYMDSLLRIIAEEIDESEISEADGNVTDSHISTVEKVLDLYVKHEMDISLKEMVPLAWNPILDAVNQDSHLNNRISELEKTLDASDLKSDWESVIGKRTPSLRDAVEYASYGEYDRACASAFGVKTDLARIFAIKMGQLARSMSSTSAPSQEELQIVSTHIEGDDGFCRLAKAIVSYGTGEIKSSEYTTAFRNAADEFEFGDTQEHMIYSYLFVDVRISLLHEFATKLADYLKEKLPIVYAYIFSILDRDAIFEKLYSVSSYDDFKDTLGVYKNRIDSILNQIQQALKKGLLQRFKREEGMKGLALKGSLQLQNYITLLTALAESPVLTISERKEVLAEVIEMYWGYFRKLLQADMPIFAHTIDSVFQSLGVACAEYYYLATGNDREKHLDLVTEFLNDIMKLSQKEWSKPSVRFSIFVVTNALATAFAKSGKFRAEAVCLLYLAMKDAEIEQLEEIKESSPDAYATNAGNIFNSLASVAYGILSNSIRDSIFSECVLHALEIQRWFVSHGVVCRDDIITVTYHTGFAAGMLSLRELRRATKLVIALNRVAIQDYKKYDYEVAMTGSSLISVLSKSWERLGNPKYLEQAQNLLRMSTAGWRKYGFSEKAENLEKFYNQRLP